MPPLPPPTLYLPAIKTITGTPPQVLFDAIGYLTTIYTPQIRASRRRASQLLFFWDKDDDLQLLQQDAFERAFSIRWLMALIAQCSIWEDGADDFSLQRRALVEKAANLLAACSGTAGAGTILRTFTFPLAKSSTSISVSIKDLPLENDDYTTLGAQTWGGASVLSEMIAENPEGFCSRNNDSQPLRVLELGAGTGLVGLAFASVAKQLWPDRSIDIVLTDFSAPILRNLESNIQANFPPSLTKTINISSHRLDWSDFASFPSSESPFNQPFHIVLGADIIYEEKHAQWIMKCLNALLTQDGCFHLVIPLRKTHSIESSTVEAVFGPQEGGKLVIQSKEAFSCDVEGGLDEVDYAYYKIVRRCTDK